MTADVFSFPKASDFEQKKPDQVRVLRHVRAYRQEEVARGKWVDTNDFEPCGGVTFLFEIDYPTQTVSFAVTACHPEENFSHAKANDKVTKMFENGCTFTGDYNSDLSLVDNAYKIFSDVYSDGLKVRGYNDFTLSAIGGQLDRALKRGNYDPNYVNLVMNIRIPATKLAEFQSSISSIIDGYNEESSQADEKAA